jgi:hypothetical protein
MIDNSDLGCLMQADVDLADPVQRDDQFVIADPCNGDLIPSVRASGQ